MVTHVAHLELTRGSPSSWIRAGSVTGVTSLSLSLLLLSLKLCYDVCAIEMGALYATRMA